MITCYAFFLFILQYTWTLGIRYEDMIDENNMVWMKMRYLYEFDNICACLLLWWLVEYVLG